MRICIIAAMDKNRVIGYDNQLPWHLPADLKHFKSLTMAKSIIMGRKTYESIGKPLPGRHNIIVTRQQHYVAKDCQIAHTLKSALQLVKSDEVFIIGGTEIFSQALPITDRLYLTLIDHEFIGDCYFPKWLAQDWLEIERVDCKADERNVYPYHFVVLQRKIMG